ncbi:hypothetical protein ACSSS7_003899 [Eimeria intestinalis]
MVLQGPARGADLALAGVSRHLDLLPPQQRVAVPRATTTAAAAAAGSSAEASAAVRSLVGQTLVKAFFQDIKDVSTHKVGLRNAFDVTLIDKLSAVVRQELIQTADPGTYGEGEGDELDLLGGERVTFTHVSSAIEGASKVYGYRVEAVYDQTYHLMNGLAALKTGGGLAPDAVDEHQQLKRRQRQQQQRLLQFAQGSESTLADFKDITNDQFDMGVVVDPFFVKMAGLFDQAGAKGLLLSNLQVDERLSLRFDGEAPAFPAATAASTAAAAADSCPIDPNALAGRLLLLLLVVSSGVAAVAVVAVARCCCCPLLLLRVAAAALCCCCTLLLLPALLLLPLAAAARCCCCPLLLLPVAAAARCCCCPLLLLPVAARHGLWKASWKAQGADEAGGSQGEEETDELLVGFEPDANEDAATGWGTQQDHHLQHQQQQQQHQHQEDMSFEQQQEHSDNDGGIPIDFVAEDFAGNDQGFGQLGGGWLGSPYGLVDLCGPDRLESLLAGPQDGSGREGLRDLEQLLTSSFLSVEGLGFKRRPQKRFAAAADEAAAPGATATASGAGKSQQLLAALDPFLIDMTNLNKQMTAYPLLKAERCIPCKGI